VGRRGLGILVCWIVATLAALLTVAARADVAVEAPIRVEAVPWARLPASVTVEGARTVRLGIDAGYCAGWQQPEFDHAEVVERPKTADRPFRSAVITLFERRAEYPAYVPPESPGRNIILCAGIGGALLPRVRLKRRLSRLFLYDGYYSPPRRVTRPFFRHGWNLPQP
jgi:hypothetical protein